MTDLPHLTDTNDTAALLGQIESLTARVVHLQNQVDQRNMDGIEAVYRPQLEQAIIQMAVELGQVALDEAEATIDDILARVGNLLQADRVVIAQYASQNPSTLRYTHEWCAIGIPSAKEVPPDMPATGSTYVDELAAARKVCVFSKLDDLPPNAQAEQSYLEKRGVKSLIFVPINTETSPYGFLRFESTRRERDWHEQNSAALILIANAIGTVIKRLDDSRSRRQSRYQYPDHYTRTLEALSETSLQLALFDDIDDILRTILRYATDLLGFERSGIYLRDDESGDFVLTKRYRPLALQAGDRPSPGIGMVGRVLTTGAPVVVEAYDSWPHRRRDIPAGHIGSGMAVPLRRDGTTLGVLYVVRSATDPISQDDVRILTLLGSQAGLAIERTRLLEDLRSSNAQLADERTQLAVHVFERTEELSIANAELAHALQMKDEFLASMSHELRTPLNTVLLLTQMLNKEMYGPLTDRQKQSLNTIGRSGNHLLTLINDVLDLSKIEAGQLDLKLAPVSIEDVCRESVEFLREIAGRKKISVRFELGERGIVVTADQRRLKQVVINLLSNAIKFTPQGGEVGLNITAAQRGRHVCIEVWDTGIGIAPKDMTRLFQPFIQLDGGLNRQHEGSGLGLTLVERMVRMHGGTVSVQSRVGEGSRFSVTLPWNDLTPAITRSPDSTGKKPLQSLLTGVPRADHDNAERLVLLADDNGPTVDVVMPFLRHHGLKVLVAHSGVSAVELAVRHQPELILMDIQMPEMDGLTAIRQLRKGPTHRSTPIIAMTALAMVGDRERCLKAGATAYLSKPLNLDELLQLVNDLLRNQPVSDLAPTGH